MKRRKVTSVLIETVETVVIRRQPAAPDERWSAWCAQCSVAVVWFTPDSAAQLTGITTRAIFHQVEAGQLHFLETDDGKLWLCSPSLGLSAVPDQVPAQPVDTKEI